MKENSKLGAHDVSELLSLAREDRAFTLRDVAERFLDACKELGVAEGRTAKAVEMWYYRTENRESARGPSEEQLKAFALALELDNVETSYLLSLPYLRTQEVVKRKKFDRSELVRMLNGAANGSEVSIEYPAGGPKAATDPSALALVYMLIVKKESRLRLFMTEHRPELTKARGQEIFVKLVLLHALASKSPPETTAVNTPEDFLRHEELARQVIKLDQIKDRLIWKDKDAQEIHSRLVVYNRQPNDCERFCPLPWLLLVPPEGADVSARAFLITDINAAMEFEDNHFARDMKTHFDDMVSLGSSRIADFEIEEAQQYAQSFKFKLVLED